MRFSTRLLASLRTTISRPSTRSTANALIRRPAFPVATASTVLTGLLVAAEAREKLNTEPYQHPVFRYDGQGDSRFSIKSLRDFPLAASDAVRGGYEGVRDGLKDRVDTEGGATVLKIITANVGVYLLWKAVPTAFMVRHFANSLESMRRGRVWTSVTSNFSHMSMFHLGANMYLLNRFGPDVADVLGAHRFYIFYGTSGIASSLASLTFRRVTKSNVLSLGASGAVVSVLWLYACFFPDRRMSFFGTDKTLTMQELVIAYTVIDAAGLLGSLGKIDFAAHLGGAFFANFWFYLVRDKLVREQAAGRRSERGYLFQNILKADGGHSKHN